MNIKKFLVFGLFAAVIGTAFANTETDQASATTKKYVMDELSELQTAIPAQSGTKAVTYTTTPGGIAPREVKTNLGTSTSDTAMPTVSAVNTGLNARQDEVPAIDTNTVLTYTSAAGEIGAKGIYQDTGNYAEQQSNLIDAGTFNAALQNALNMEFVCAGYVDDDPTKPCWLWQIHTAEESPLNLYDPVTNPIERGTIAGATGQNAEYNARLRTSGYIDVEPNATYTISEGGLNYLLVYFYHLDGSYASSSWQPSPYTITTSANTNRIRIVLSQSTSSQDPIVVTPSDLQWLQVERGPTATPHPYTTLVPAGYTPLEYIESTGTQYIDTGVKPKNTTGLKLKFNRSTTGDQVVMGIVSNYLFAYQIMVNAASRLYIPFAEAYGLAAVPNMVNNTDYDVSINYMNDRAQYVNGIIKKSITTTLEPVGVSMPIFAGYSTASHDYGWFFNGKIYYVVITEGTQTVRDFIPARRNSDNAIGMYDKVTGTFFTNAGTGTFTAGPEVSNIVYIPQGQ